MAILRVFLGEALHPALGHVYHRNRTISLVGMPGSKVAYDMPIEKENLTISTNVTNASRESNAKYVRELNFKGPVSRAAERAPLANRSMQPKERKKIDDDVDAVVAFLKQKLGATWSDASQRRCSG
eukprot:6213844-Pleurochrysis_carterae.AAC.9